MFNQNVLLELTYCHLSALYKIEKQILPNGVLETPRIKKTNGMSDYNWSARH